MSKFLYRLNLNIKRFFGRESTVIISHTVISLIIYVLLVNSTIKFNFTRINSIYSSDLATISGILFGFIGTAFGIIITSKNKILDRLNLTDNIRVVYKTILYALIGFMVCLIIYFIKPFFICPDTTSIIDIDQNIFIIILHIGLFSFINSLVLFLRSIYYLKKIFLPKIKR